MTLAEKLQSAIQKEATGLWPDVKIPPIDVTEPPLPEFGDLSTPLPLTLAKLISRKPLDIAYKIREALEKTKIEHVKEITISEPGYINFIIDFQNLSPHLLKKILSQKKEFGTIKDHRGNVVIEHTSVNPNKAAHVGHLRNACLGDSLARIMNAMGFATETQNYIDDLGLQVADSVVAFEVFGDAPSGISIDKWFWKIYADINKKYKGQLKLLERREVILSEMEKGENKTAQEIVKKIVKAHLATFKQFEIDYDLLVYEHDIVRSQLWDKLFEELKDKKLITQATAGEQTGAWLVEFGKTDREDKILVRSNNIPTYTAKDIAYQLWKFNQSTMPNYQRKFDKVNQVINVIDNRQAYPQAVIKYVLAKLGYTKEAENSDHLAYGIVKLSEKAMKSLGETTGGKATYSMSGRAGIGVMVNDLFDTAWNKQIKEYQTSQDTARKIAAGSIRYYLLKTRPNRESIFDFDEALRADGNTGVYLQYAYARCHNIIDKVPGWSPEPERLKVPKEISVESTKLLKLLENYPYILKTAAGELDPSLLADYAFNLANNFARFYENNPVLQSDEKLKNFRLHLVAGVKQILENALWMLGIPILERV